MAPPQRAKPARKSARCGVGDGSPRPHPPHPQPVGSAPQPHPPKDGRSGMGERSTPDAPHTGKRRPPWAPWCCPHSAQSQLARARTVGLVTGPHAHYPCTHSQWVVGPGRTLQRTGGRGWESACPWTPHTQARIAPPPGALVPPPQRAEPAGMSARCGVDDGSPRPHSRTHIMWVVDPARTPQRTGGRGWESARPGRCTHRQEPPPLGALVLPPQRAKPAYKSACCGVGDGSPRPHPPHPQPVGSGPRPHPPKDGRSGVGERSTPDAPHTRKRRPPWAPWCCPHSAQSQLARARTVGLVTGPHAHTPRTHSQ